MEAKKASATHDLSIVPDLTFGFVEKFVKRDSQSLGEKEISKGYKYFCERYVTNITTHNAVNGCVVKGKCHRSQRKNESPHDIEIVLLDGPCVESSRCSCTIGQSGHCGHVTGLLFTLAHMKSANLKCIPSDVLKTSLPQTWHVPRGEKICGSSAENVIVHGYNAKSSPQQPRGLRSTLYNPINSVVPKISELCSRVSEADKTCLLLTVVNLSGKGDCEYTETKFGKFPKGSPLAVQQKLSPHYVLNILDASEFPLLPAENLMEQHLHIILDEKRTGSFSSIFVSEEECHQIEEMTRLQGESPKWHAIRRERITASVAGDIVKRRAAYEPLTGRLKTTRKVVTESMRHGLSFEAVAADAFVRLLDNNVNIYPCGVVVSPYAPWLAATPDRKVYNPTMNQPYGLLEIKCPVKPLSECNYLTKVGDVWRLKKNHNYFYQVMIQLAVTGLNWCYFFVWLCDENHLEVIEFDEEEWQDMKNKIDSFYFDHFLE
ncbi:uncharacterized protein LOC125676125 [Ostrea edulis]|uniref:uncharacterized protein LOC125676125 n=1 Tax=Ostrea edulis TaxID=37623 RepID=UPI0024AEFFF7|nr:uncharacterized protein LOC125676125 [Ostrea edulis]